MPVILLSGDEDFNIEKSLKAIRKKVLTEDFGGMNHKVLRISDSKKEPNFRDILEYIETPAMMFGNLLIEIHSTGLFTRGKTSDEKSLDRLIDDLNNLNDNVHVVFVCQFSKERPQKIDSAKKIVKAIKNIGKIEEFASFKNYEINKVVAWLKQAAKEKELVISDDSASFLATQVGFELRKLDNELDKIKTYIHPKKEIKKEDVSKVCQSSEDVFRMADFWLKQDKQSAMSELEKLLEKNPPQKIIAVIQTVTRKWLRVKLESKNKTAQEIAQIMGMHPFVVEQEVKKLNKVSVEQLVRFRKNLNKIEFDMKSGRISPEISLEMLIAG